VTQDDQQKPPQTPGEDLPRPGYLYPLRPFLKTNFPGIR